MSDLDLEVTLSFRPISPPTFAPHRAGHLLREIVRKLPDGATPRSPRDASLSGVTLRAGRSRFSLQVLRPTTSPRCRRKPRLAARSPGQGSVAAIGAIAFAISTEKRATI